MGTPGYVGVLNDDGSILAKYKHYDCDSMSLGVILLDFYQDPERVKAVLADNNYPINRFLPTNDEELKEFINKAKTEKYDVDDFDNIFKSVEDFKNSSVHVEYSYLYDQKSNEWLVSTLHSPLAELIEDFEDHLLSTSLLGDRHKNKALDHAISLFLDNPDYFKKLTPYQLKLFDDTLAQETIYQKAREFIPLKQFLPYELNKCLNYWIQNNRDHKSDSTIEYFNNLIEECVDKNFFTKMDYRSCSENLIIPAHNEFFLNIDSILKKVYNVVSACKEADQKLFDEYDKKLADCFEPLELKGFVGLIKKKCTELGVKISVKYRNNIYSPFIDLSSPDGTSISEDQMHKIEDFIDEIKIHNTGLFHDLNNDIIYKISNHVFENGKPAIDFPKSDNKIKYFPTEFCHIYTSDLNVVEESNDIKQDLDESIKASDNIDYRNLPNQDYNIVFVEAAKDDPELLKTSGKYIKFDRIWKVPKQDFNNDNLELINKLCFKTFDDVLACTPMSKSELTKFILTNQNELSKKQQIDNKQLNSNKVKENSKNKGLKI